MSTQIEKAKAFAQEIHKGHFRRDGVTPYFSHLEAVVKNCNDLLNLNFSAGLYIGNNDDIISAAWLHDSVEDGKTNLQDIETNFGVGVRILIQLLTHNKGEDYFDYIRRANKFADSRMIKIADVLANLADSPTQKQLVKYTEALKILIK